MMLPKSRSDLTVRQVEDELVIVDRRSGQVHHLNPTAAFIWSKLDGNSTVEAIVSAVMEDFGVGRETAATDVEGLIERFRGLDLLVEPGT